MRSRAINPKIWGSSAWSLLHRLSFVIKTGKEMRVIIDALPYLLPCPKCRESLSEHFKRLPVPTHKVAMPKWLYRLHNRVSDSTENPQKIAYKDVREKWRSAKMINDDIEWIFIEAIIAVYRGPQRESVEYVENLRRFLEIWAKHSDLIELPNDMNKQSLEEWIRKNKKHMLMRFKNCEMKCSV